MLNGRVPPNWKISLAALLSAWKEENSKVSSFLANANECSQAFFSFLLSFLFPSFQVSLDLYQFFLFSFAFVPTNLFNWGFFLPFFFFFVVHFYLSFASVPFAMSTFDAHV